MVWVNDIDTTYILDTERRPSKALFAFKYIAIVRFFFLWELFSISCR